MTGGRQRATTFAEWAGRSIPALFAGGCAACLLGLVGCVHATTPQEEARSVAEQDLGADARQNGRLREAFNHVQRALKFDPDNAAASYLGSVVLLQFCALDEHSSDCRFKEAEAFARKALELDPDHRDARNSLGVILVHEHRYDEAITVLKPLTEDLVLQQPRVRVGQPRVGLPRAWQHGRGD